MASIRWCGRCCTTHDGNCPKKPVWQKRIGTLQSGRGGRPWRRKRLEVFERDGYLCQLCGKPVEKSGPNTGICDHRVPLSQGGSEDDDNLQTICASCDVEKTHSESLQARGVGKTFSGS